MALQTIVSREDNPLDPAVVTVGSIHGGTQYNIIPDEVKLQLSVRSYKPEVRKHLLASIERVAKGEALAAGATREPLVTVAHSINSAYNDPALTKRIAAALGNTFGQSQLRKSSKTYLVTPPKTRGPAFHPPCFTWARLSREGSPPRNSRALNSQACIPRSGRPTANAL